MQCVNLGSQLNTCLITKGEPSCSLREVLTLPVFHELVGGPYIERESWIDIIQIVTVLPAHLESKVPPSILAANIAYSKECVRFLCFASIPHMCISTRETEAQGREIR